LAEADLQATGTHSLRRRNVAGALLTASPFQAGAGAKAGETRRRR
jgi:hypothetical protein